MLSQWDLEIAREAERRGAIALIGGSSFGGGPVLAASEPGVAPVKPDTSAPSTDGPAIEASGDLFRMDSLVVMGIDHTQYAELTTLMSHGEVDITLTGEDVTDQIAAFSSRGPSGTFGLKPDLVAPGVRIRSTLPSSIFAPGQYLMSGTSMAAPHVAGAAALLHQLQPDQSPAVVKSTLVGTAKPLSDTGPTTHGSGRLDVAAAAAATVTASPASLSYGLADLSSRSGGRHEDADLAQPQRLAPRRSPRR